MAERGEAVTVSLGLLVTGDLRKSEEEKSINISIANTILDLENDTSGPLQREM